MSEKKVMEFEALAKVRMEKDLKELQVMIERHFKQRKIDNEELRVLTERIEKRKLARVDQIKMKQEREQNRMQAEKDVRERAASEEKDKKNEAEERKLAAMAAMTANKYGGYLSRDRAGKGNKRTTEREKKRRALAERKTQLTVDHMKKDNLIEKLKQLWTFLYNLEHERFDFEDVNDNQRYDVSQLRARVTDYMAKQGKGIKQQKPKGLGGAANVGAKLAALKAK